MIITTLNTGVEWDTETGQMTPSWHLNRDTCQGWGVLTFVLELAENSSLDLDSIASPCSVLIQMSDFHSIWHHQTLTHIRIVTSWDFLANLTLLPPWANLCSLVLDSIASPSSDPDFRFSLHWAPLYQDIVTSWDFLANLTPCLLGLICAFPHRAANLYQATTGHRVYYPSIQGRPNRGNPKSALKVPKLVIPFNVPKIASILGQKS